MTPERMRQYGKGLGLWQFLGCTGREGIRTMGLINASAPIIHMTG